MKLRVTLITALILAACVAVSLGVASPAGAQMRICTSKLCVASANSCWITVSHDGVSGELIFDEGDTVISTSGQTWICKGGQWYVVAAAPTTGVLAPSSGQKQ